MAPVLRERFSIFFIGTTLSLWLLVIDGLNFSLNWNENTENELWVKSVISITGYSFCLFTMIGCFMILFWIKPKIATLMIVFVSFIAGSARFVTTVIGFGHFKIQESYLDTIQSGATDVVILNFQLYLLFSTIYLYINAEPEGYTKIGDMNDTGSNYMVEINDETIFDASAPTNIGQEKYTKNGYDTKEYMKAYD